MTNARADVGVVLVAAGGSTRMGGERPKVYLELAGRPLLAHSLRTLASWPELAALALVVRDADRELATTIVREHAPNLFSRTRVVAGGAERRDSVRHGLTALANEPFAVVLVHDAARPLASRELFARVATAARSEGAAVPALPIVDTLKRADASGRLATVPREGLHAVQTPQGFERHLLERAHAQELLSATITDDAMLVEALPARVALVPGEPWNLKVTTPADLELVRRTIRLRDEEGGGVLATRIGLGHDLHRLAAGGPLRLGGVELASDVHAIGHSDGDALLHAVTDAVLGALALGDLGQHFSDRAPENRGRDSADFLRHALALARERGFAPAQADVVVKLERPALAPHREALVMRLAALLGVAPSFVSIKAKSGEGVDAVGRGEAIACDAIVQMARIIVP